MKKGHTAHLQAVSYPPVEDGQVGLGGKNDGRQIDLVVPAGDGNHLQMDFLQRSCGKRHHDFTKVGDWMVGGH